MALDCRWFFGLNKAWDSKRVWIEDTVVQRTLFGLQMVFWREKRFGLKTGVEWRCGSAAGTRPESHVVNVS